MSELPITRLEQFLAAASGQGITLPEPITREEMYLARITQGGGEGGTTDYNALENRPRINGITLAGNLSPADIGAVPSASVGVAGGVAAYDYTQPKLTFDSAPTPGSTNPVTSEGIYTAIQQGGGISSYADLTNKPSIGGVTLIGNKTLNDFGAASAADVGDLSTLATTARGSLVSAINEVATKAQALSASELEALKDAFTI